MPPIPERDDVFVALVRERFDAPCRRHGFAFNAAPVASRAEVLDEYLERARDDPPSEDGRQVVDQHGGRPEVDVAGCRVGQ